VRNFRSDLANSPVTLRDVRTVIFPDTIFVLTECRSALFTVAISFALGITFAVSTCASVSGGHFNPAVTISSAVFKGFPPAKAAR
jgi:glycerol uptake facilitator-like aquaporin